MQEERAKIAMGSDAADPFWGWVGTPSKNEHSLCVLVLFLFTVHGGCFELPAPFELAAVLYN